MMAWKYVGAKRVLLLARKDDFACLPTDLHNIFDRLEGTVVDLETDRPLVGADGEAIRRNLGTQGWHIWPAA